MIEFLNKYYGWWRNKSSGQNTNPSFPSSTEAGKEWGTFTVEEVASFFIPE